MSEILALRESAVAAAQAGAGALEPFLAKERALSIEEKGAHDFVTAADHAAEDAVREEILRRHPDHQILGEEGDKVSLDNDGPLWIVDPLDGTTNFIHGYPVFAVSVACAVEGRVVAGAILDPSRGDLYAAARGAGAMLNGHFLTASKRTSLDEALIATGFPFRRIERLESFLGTFREVLRRASGIRRPGSAALDLASVAAGRMDGFWEEGLGPWDIAAGGLMIEEAGGVISDFGGGARYLETGAVVAGSGGVHAELREIVFRHQGEGC